MIDCVGESVESSMREQSSLKNAKTIHQLNCLCLPLCLLLHVWPCVCCSVSVGEYMTLAEVRDAVDKLTGAAINGSIVKLIPLVRGGVWGRGVAGGRGENVCVGGRHLLEGRGVVRLTPLVKAGGGGHTLGLLQGEG